MTSRKNATVLALSDYRKRYRPIYFTRGELNLLLSLYSRQVSRGVWRDYAIDHAVGMALFSVFRHTHERAVFTIVKATGSAGQAEFRVLSGRQKLRAARSLAEALDYFRAQLSLVAAEAD